MPMTCAQETEQQEWTMATVHADVATVEVPPFPFFAFIYFSVFIFINVF